MFCMGDLATFLSHEVKYFCVIVPDAVSLPSVTFHLPPVRMGVSVIVCSRHLRQRNDDPHQKPGLCGRHGHRCHAHWGRHLPARCVCVCKPTLFLFALFQWCNDALFRERVSASHTSISPCSCASISLFLPSPCPLFALSLPSQDPSARLWTSSSRLIRRTWRGCVSPSHIFHSQLARTWKLQSRNVHMLSPFHFCLFCVALASVRTASRTHRYHPHACLPHTSHLWVLSVYRCSQVTVVGGAGAPSGPPRSWRPFQWPSLQRSPGPRTAASSPSLQRCARCSAFVHLRRDLCLKPAHRYAIQFPSALDALLSSFMCTVTILWTVGNVCTQDTPSLLDRAFEADWGHSKVRVHAEIVAAV